MFLLSRHFISSRNVRQHQTNITWVFNVSSQPFPSHRSHRMKLDVIRWAGHLKPVSCVPAHYLHCPSSLGSGNISVTKSEPDHWFNLTALDK